MHRTPPELPPAQHIPKRPVMARRDEHVLCSSPRPPQTMARVSPTSPSWTPPDADCFTCVCQDLFIGSMVPYTCLPRFLFGSEYWTHAYQHGSTVPIGITHAHHDLSVVSIGLAYHGLIIIPWFNYWNYWFSNTYHD